MPARRTLLLYWCLLALPVLSACGQKGPLYLPEELQPTPAVEAATPSTHSTDTETATEGAAPPVTTP